MNERTDTLLTAAQMREAFDEDFARPSDVASRQEEQNFLVVALGASRHALRLGEVAAIQRAEVITPLPGPLRELQGLAHHQGAVLPVYDLTAMLGLGHGTGAWQIVMRHASVMLGVDAFHRHVRCPIEQLAPLSGGQQERGFIDAHLATDEGVWPVINLASVIEVIAQRARPATQET